MIPHNKGRGWPCGGAFSPPGKGRCKPKVMGSGSIRRTNQNQQDQGGREQRRVWIKGPRWMTHHPRDWRCLIVLRLFESEPKTTRKLSHQRVKGGTSWRLSPAAPVLPKPMPFYADVGHFRSSFGLGRVSGGGDLGLKDSWDGWGKCCRCVRAL